MYRNSNLVFVLPMKTCKNLSQKHNQFCMHMSLYYLGYITLVFGWLAELETVRSLIIFMTVFSAFLQPFFPCLIAVLCQEILIMCDKVDKPQKPAFIMAASSYLKGAFNNYEDLILPNFDHLPSSSGKLWTS